VVGLNVAGHKIPEDIKNKGLQKLMPPYNWSLRQVASELGVGTGTVWNWRQELEIRGLLMSKDEEFQHLSSDKIFTHVLETAKMSEHQLAEYCRQKGLFVEQLKQWKTSCMDANKPDQKMRYQDSKEQRAANKRIKELEKELNRKEKALAETAALLVLREKYNALWEAKEEE
jgi:transposase